MATSDFLPCPTSCPFRLPPRLGGGWPPQKSQAGHRLLPACSERATAGSVGHSPPHPRLTGAPGRVQPPRQQGLLWALVSFLLLRVAAGKAWEQPPPPRPTPPCPAGPSPTHSPPATPTGKPWPRASRLPHALSAAFVREDCPEPAWLRGGCSRAPSQGLPGSEAAVRASRQGWLPAPPGLSPAPPPLPGRTSSRRGSCHSGPPKAPLPTPKPGCS